MPEWWSYGLSDFLLFSPRTYYRLLERHNRELWPGQIVAAGLGVLIIWLLRHPSKRQGRIISAIIAALWTWVAWSFLLQRYATINWAVRYVLPAFALEALLFLWIGTVRGRWSFGPSRHPAHIIGGLLLVLSLAVYPLLSPLAGRPWEQAEIFGVVPDPTVLATLGLLLLARGGPRAALLIVPILWCLMSGLTLLAMGSPEAWLQLMAPLAVGVAAVGSGRFRDRPVAL